MPGKIYLFPDTNLFIQCRPLGELDWSDWSSFDEISLLVTRPVQAEIDRQKGGGNSRLAKRARTTSSLFRGILLRDGKFIEVRNGGPVVRIYLRQDLKHDESLSNQLDYGERDDQLVGIAALFAKNNPGTNVQILTHDTGPMASADMVGVQFKEIPESWLLLPETDEAEKRLQSLQAEVQRLKKAEPAVEIKFGNLEAGDARTDFEIPVYMELGEEQVNKLLSRIAERFPPETDFGPTEPQEQRDKFKYPLFMERKIFTPATSEAIAAYQNEHYPKWLHKCEEILRSAHHLLNGATRWPNITVLLSNVGSRPADDTLITFSARGDFQVQPAPYQRNEESDPIEQEIALPHPPDPPRGTWTTKRMNLDMIGGTWPTVTQLAPSYPDHRALLKPISRDPNSFYYKNRPTAPVDAFSLTCDQWRHQDEVEALDLTVHVKLKPSMTAGAIEVKVQAANMADPVIKRHAIVVTCVEKSAFAEAEDLVSKLMAAAH